MVLEFENWNYDGDFPDHYLLYLRTIRAITGHRGVIIGYEIDDINVDKILDILWRYSINSDDELTQKYINKTSTRLINIIMNHVDSPIHQEGWSLGEDNHNNIKRIYRGRAHKKLFKLVILLAYLYDIIKYYKYCTLYIGIFYNDTLKIENQEILSL